MSQARGGGGGEAHVIVAKFKPPNASFTFFFVLICILFCSNKIGKLKNKSSKKLNEFKLFVQKKMQHLHGYTNH